MKLTELKLLSLCDKFPVKFAVTIFLLTGLFYGTGWTQESEPVRSRISLTLTQFPGDKAEFTALLRAKVNERYITIPGAEINFYYIGEEDETELGSDTTNSQGIAKVSIDDLAKFIPSEDGYLVFGASFEGNNDYQDSDSDTEIKRVNIEYDVDNEAEPKLVSITVTEANEEETPAEELEVFILVPRLFSDFIISDDYTDEDGYVEFEFPADIPGDENGNLDIVVRCPDTDDYGNIEVRMTSEWGVPQAHMISKLPRALWSPYPPIWLLMTFLGILAFIWAHYIEVIYNLVKMKKRLKQE